VKPLIIAPIMAAAMMILPVTSASARWTHGWHRHHHAWNHGWHRYGWVSRNVSDPGRANRYARRTARRLGGGCAVDLGYGRYEVCD